MAFARGDWLPPLRSSALSIRIVFLIALLIGAVYALSIFDVSFILGRSAFWTEPVGDSIMNRIGALYFIQDNWRFPLFFVPKLNFPEGVSIVFTDSIPLVALIFKVVYKLSGEVFNYFGFWLFACFPLLAACMALATKEAGVDDLIVILGASLLALASPAFLLRWGHFGLMGQFLIAWGIFLYFRLRRDPDSRAALVQFCVCLASTILVQVYFFAMVFPFFLAALIQSTVERRLGAARALMSFGLVTAVAVVTAWIAGIIGGGGLPHTIGGFGVFSMNALSPFLPPRARLPEFLAKLVTWDLSGRSWDATDGGQWEGYNYLGGGMLLLCVIHLVASRSIVASALKRHAALVVMLVGFTLYALSNKIYVGDWLAVDVKLPWLLAEITGHFRTGGRFFWPVYYVLVVALVYATWRRFDLPIARVVIIAAVALQLADTQFLRGPRGNDGYPQEVARDQWRPLLAAHRFLKQYPSFQCGGWAGDWQENNSNMELLLLAAELNVPTNSAYLARPNRPCADERTEGLQFQIEADGLYTYGRPFPIGAIKELPSFRDWCREFEYGVVCSRNWTASRLANLSAFKPITRWVIPSYKLGEELKFSDGGKGESYLGEGWSGAEEWGIWSMGHRSEIVLQLPHVDGNLRLTVAAHAYVHPARPHKEITVVINDRPMATWSFNIGEGTKKRSIEIPNDILRQTGILRIRFDSPVAESPKEAGRGEDEREISLGLVDLTIEQATSAENSNTPSNR